MKKRREKREMKKRREKREMKRLRKKETKRAIPSSTNFAVFAKICTEHRSDPFSLILYVEMVFLPLLAALASHYASDV